MRFWITIKLVMTLSDAHCASVQNARSGAAASSVSRGTRRRPPATGWGTRPSTSRSSSSQVIILFPVPHSTSGLQTWTWSMTSGSWRMLPRKLTSKSQNIFIKLKTQVLLQFSNINTNEIIRLVVDMNFELTTQSIHQNFIISLFL